MRTSKLNFRRPSALRAVLLAVFTGLMLAVSVLVAVPSQAAESQNASWCPSFRVFLARGSRGVDLTLAGILPADYSAKDTTMQTFWDTFTKKMPKSDKVWVAYQAVPVVTGDIVGYENSILSGVASMHAAVHGFAKACPDSHWGMGGYSQGADLVGQYSKFLGRNPGLWRDTPKLLQNLKFAVVLANPSRNSAVPSIERRKPFATHDGLIRQAYELIFLGDQVPERLMTPKGVHLKLTGSYCIQHDPVCDFEGIPFALWNWPLHLKYGPVAKQAADWAAKLALAA